MKNVLTGFAAGVLLLLAIAYFIKPGWLCGSLPAAERKPLISLADMAMEVSEREGNNLQTLVALDKQFYMAMLQSSNLSKQYFYARHGSCCPCSTGGMRCCMCPPRSAFGAMQGSTEIDEAFLHSQTMSKFAALSDVQDMPKINLEENETEGVRIFSIPKSVTGGTYTVTFKGKINMEIDILVNSDQTFDVVAIR